MYRDMDARLAALEERLGVTFRDRKLLLEAVTHRSYLNESRVRLPHNERLEFLGDAVLELIVTEHLFRKFPQEEEGVLTNWRAALVKGEFLSEIGKRLGLNDILLLSRGEAKNRDGKARARLLENAVEAIIGAVYFDQGLPSCRLFVDHYVLVSLAKTLAATQDAKSELQEWVQAECRITPSYDVLAEWGLDHAKRFRVAVNVGGTHVAEAEGTSKDGAQKAAAAKALATKDQWKGRLLGRGRPAAANAAPKG